MAVPTTLADLETRFVALRLEADELAQGAYCLAAPTIQTRPAAPRRR
jgi:hypothetical protein